MNKKKKAKKRILSQVFAAISASALIFGNVPGLGVNDAKAANQDKGNDGNSLRLWYDSPADISTYRSWEQWSLPIGNSAIGASVFGGVDTERIQLNEKSLWSGGPSDSRPLYNGGNIEANGAGGKTVKRIQQLFREGKNSAASSLCRSLTGEGDENGDEGYGYYLSYGNMYLDFRNGASPENVENYERDLNLKNAVSSVDYDYKGTHYHRENFVSYPDNVLVTKLTADGGTMDFDVRVEPDNEQGGGSASASNASYSRTWDKTVKDGLISIDGKLNDNEMQFSSQTKVIADDGGTVEDTSDKVSVTGAKEVTIYTSIGTDYKNTYPTYRTGELTENVSAKVKAYVDKASAKGYDAVKEVHIRDFSSIFDRVDLNLGQGVSEKTTDVLLSSYNSGDASEAERRQLEVMLFQYGRYLTIESSRETPAEDSERKTLPSNLQGIWAGANNSALHAAYRMNVNLQMNYWPTYSTNMAECAQPLIAYVEGLREPGRVTAKVYAGIGDGSSETGYMAHTQNNPFGWTCPGWDFDEGWSPAAVPWILQNCWDYYDFTGDTEYLRTEIYPMMREEALLYDQMLVDDGTGHLVSSPSYSPEHGPRTPGNTYEQTLIWQLYQDTIQAAGILGVDAENVAVWKDKQSKLKGPVEIGDSGQIKEWYEETTVNDSVSGSQGFQHRYLSHMLGLFPGDLISPDTPKWFEAAKVSMNNRTDESTGGGIGQRINTWARLADGNRSYKLITDLFKKGILTNLWSTTNASFRIDGNFGMTSGVAEMLLQSNQGYINLLPALPDTWAKGSVNGLVARGNFGINMDWEDGYLKKAEILSNNGGTATVQFKGAALATVVDSKGNILEATAISNDRISFDTNSGETYTIKDVPDTRLAFAPTGLKAERLYGDKVDLTWDAYDAGGKSVTYNVYRQVKDGDVQRIETGLTTSSYTDVKARDFLGAITYQVSAVIDEKESDRCAMSAVTDLRNMAGMVDDKDLRITYSEGWSDYDNHGAPNYKDTIKYIEFPTGNESLKMDFVGTGIEVISCTNRDRGMYKVLIDGKDEGNIDTYSSTKKFQQAVYTKDDLAYGWHTIELKVLGEKNPASSRAKVEFDAFRVLNTNVLMPDSLEVSSVSGITLIGKADSSVQMQAVVKPANTSDKSVTWSVDNDLASIDENGLLTVGNRNGTVVVTAVSNADKNIVSKKEIQIAIAGNVADEIIVEDSPDKKDKNPDITWSDGWSTIASPDHHGGSKTVSTAGKYFEYTFNGTGIEVYSHYHSDSGNLEVTLDNVVVDTAPLGETNADEKAKLVFSKTDLTNGQHTIKCTIKERDSKKEGSLDYLKIFRPSTSAEKADLQNEITSCDNLIEKAYDSEKWTAFKEKFDAAVEIMNKPDANDTEVADALQGLKTAKGNLGDPSLPPPVVRDGLKAEVILAESTNAVISWDKVDDAKSYTVRVRSGTNSAKGTSVRAASPLTDKVIMKIEDVKDTWCSLAPLQPASVYEVSINAVNEYGNESAKAIVIPVETTASIDTTGPSRVTGITKRAVGKDSVKLSWTAPADKDVAGYYVYTDNIKAAEIKGKSQTTWTMSGLTVDQTYVVKIVAYDNSLNMSLPAQFTFTFSEERIIAGITVSPSELEAAKGTAFNDLKLPGTATVTYRTGLNEKDVPVKWKKGDYKEDTAGSYIIYGALNTGILMDNPDNLKPSVKVTVKDSTVPAPDPDNPPNIPGNPSKGGQQNTPGNNNANQQKPSAQPAKTGDESNPAIWAGVLVAAALAATGTAVIILKKKRNKTE